MNAHERRKQRRAQVWGSSAEPTASARLVDGASVPFNSAAGAYRETNPNSHGLVMLDDLTSHIRIGVWAAAIGIGATCWAVIVIACWWAWKFFGA